MSESPSESPRRTPADLLWANAPEPVRCEAGGMHDPRTLERLVRGQHLKISVCRKCDKVA